MKALLIATALLVGCGTDGPSNNDPKPEVFGATLSEGNPYVNLDITREIEGCAWEVSIHTAEVTDESLTAGGHLLLRRYNSKTGVVYSLQEGLITRWAEVSDGVMKVGLQCYNPKDFI